MVAGGLIAFYYMAIFSIALPGANVVNIGLMNERTNGVIFGALVAAIGGGILIVDALRKGPTANVQVNNITVAPPPTQPPGFYIPLNMAMTYSKPPSNQAAMSFPAWKISVADHQRRIGRQTPFTDRMYEWGHQWGVPPERFTEFVEYIESLKSYQIAMKRMN